MEKEKILSIVGIIIIVIFIAWNFDDIYESFEKFRNRVCIKSHEERYVDVPPSVVVGGTNVNGVHFGGIAIPMGDGEIKIKTVCDEYKY